MRIWAWVDRCVVPVFDASLAALALWSLAALAILASTQPARRLRLARAAALGSLAIWPLVGGNLLPRLDLARMLGDLGVLHHPGLAFLGIDDASVTSATLDPADLSVWAHWLARALTVGYLAGVIAGIGWLMLGFLALRALADGSRAPMPATASLYQSLPFAHQRARPRLRVCQRLRQPVLAGVWHPLILIPASLEDSEPFETGRLRLSLLHELAHAEASDQRYSLVGNLAGALWFFIPPWRWVCAQARLDQEFLADRRAAEGFGSAREYASSLLELATSRPPAGGPHATAAPPPATTRTASSHLFQRVLMLLRCPFPVETKPPAWWCWGLPGLAALVTLTLSSVAVRLPRPLSITNPALRRFHLSRLETLASPPGAEGSAPLRELPMRLPERFELTLELWGDSDRLARTRVVGLLLGMPPAVPDLERWHTVRIIRDEGGTRLWVDEQVVPRGSNPEPLTAWLSVQSALDFPAKIRDLTLTW